jgi:prepilin-type N-terminal cleavage/methylation domain-containing protein
MPGNNHPTKKYSAGFTLIEMMVVVALFSLLGLVLIDVYSLTLGGQRQAAKRQDVVGVLRYTMETVSAQVRTGAVDYTQSWGGDTDTGIVGPEQELFLVGANGVAYRYWLVDGVLQVQTGSGVSAQVAALNDPTQVRVDAFTVVIDPPADPFAQELCSENNDCQSTTTAPPGAGGCSVCTGSDCPINQPETGICRCVVDDDCGVTQRCNVGTGLCAPYDVQPRVTVSLTATSMSARAIERKTITVQTTVASRQYLR